MAHRAFFALTFAAAGLCLAACGGGDGTVADTGDGIGSEQPPANAEQPPASSDQPPGNADQPPTNPDQPPGNGDQTPSAGGGGGSTACQKLCAQYAECPGPGINEIVRETCKDDCASTDAAASCAQLVAAAISCVTNLPGLCTESPPAFDGCTAALQAASACIDQ